MVDGAVNFVHANGPLYFSDQLDFISDVAGTDLQRFQAIWSPFARRVVVDVVLAGRMVFCHASRLGG